MTTVLPNSMPLTLALLDPSEGTLITVVVLLVSVTVAPSVTLAGTGMFAAAPEVFVGVPDMAEVMS